MPVSSHLLVHPSINHSILFSPLSINPACLSFFYLSITLVATQASLPSTPPTLYSPTCQ